jgi:hypothetical protein
MAPLGPTRLIRQNLYQRLHHRPSPVVSVTDLNPTQLYEYKKKEDRKWRTEVEKAEKRRKNLAELIHSILDRVSDDYRSRILQRGSILER